MVKIGEKSPLQLVYKDTKNYICNKNYFEKSEF